MKKFFYQLVVILMAILPIAFVSCSDDDDEVLSSNDLVGTWKWDSFGGNEMEDFFGNQYLQFSANGQFVEVDIYNDEVDVTRGEWRRSGNTITISAKGSITTTTEIFGLTSTDLILVTLGIPMSYKRVDDSDIEQYLN